MKRFRFNDYLSTAAILLLLVIFIQLTGLLSRVDNVLFDIGQKWHQGKPPVDIVIVAIDENSLSQLGRWPWSRQVHADLIQRLKQENTLAIGLDIIFSEPEQANKNADKALVNAIAQARNVVLPILLETTRVKGQLIETLPLPNLALQAADLGRVHAVLDEDGIARSIYLFEGVGAPVWQHFSQAVLNVATNQPSQNQFNVSAAQKNTFSLVREQQKRVSFKGPPGYFSTISYVQVLKGEFEKDTFRNKIVLIGATASGMNDLLSTPVSGLSQPMAGVEFHANVLDSMRNNRLIETLSTLPSLIVLIALALLPLIWMPRLSALTGLISTLVYFVFVSIMAAVLPKIFSIWIPPSAALLPILISYPVWSWRKLEAAQRYLDQELTYLKSFIIQSDFADNTIHRYDSFDDRIEQVRAAGQQLRFLQNDRKEVLAFISHDLRAPLASAMMLLEEHQQLQSKLYAPLSQALHLAEDFLQASRAEMSNSADFKELDFAGVTHQAVDDAYENALKKKITLERDIVGGLVWVNGNFGLLHRAILNLVMNAIKFAPECSVVVIKLSYASQQAVLNVIDNGPGISIDEQKQLFRRFSRLKDTSATPDGAGLGLYFVHTVAEKHRGSVNVESDMGQQTSFNLRLPVLNFQSH
ncbi:MAG: histidine kinase [Proteobacteria bacterium ST_bin12]|nr:MAG: histidine kinase [Proteobacteria bacterium ST_bin12]